MTNTNDYKKILDEIQKIVYADIKPKGFLKKGRTHNRKIDDGIIQVVNFQMDKYPIGLNYIIPGLRKSFWGKFTVNLGVYVDELFSVFHNQDKKAFAQEYDCEIRTRLSHLTICKDEWYPLDKNYLDIAEKIIDGLSGEAQSWFERFSTREKIVSDLRNKKQIEFSPREKLSAAVIQLGIDRQDGEKIFNEYLFSIDEKKPHKKWVTDIAEKLKIDIKKTVQNK